MIENKNIYKGLECYCNEFEKIPIYSLGFGVAGSVVNYEIDKRKLKWKI